MYFLLASPDTDTLSIVRSNRPLQTESESVGIYRLVKSNKPLYQQFEHLLTKYHAHLKDGKGITIEKDGSISLFHHDFL